MDPTNDELAELGRLMLEAWDVNPEWWERHLPLTVMWKIKEIRRE